MLCQQGQSVWIHTIGDVEKVAACKVKLFQLVDRDSIKDSIPKKVMLEDRLKDVEDLLDPEDLEGDTFGAKYLRMVKTVSFSNICTYSIELS